MANVDGDVKIRVSLDSKHAERGADRVKRKMESLAKKITNTFSATARQEDVENQVAGYEKQISAIEKTIRAEQERISLLKKMRKEVEYSSETRDLVDSMGITDLEAEIDTSYKKISTARKEIKEYKREIQTCVKTTQELGQETNPVADGIKRLGDRMNRMVRRVFVFNIILKALRAMKDGLVNLLSQDSAVAKSMAQIKGSLYAAFLPIYDYALPAIRWLMSALAQLTSAIANVIGTLFGVNAAALANAYALKQQAGATGSAGNAAKKAAKQLAAFDEINQLSQESSASGSGGGSSGSSWDFSGLNQVTDKFNRIAKIVLAIGAGIGAWKLATALGALKDAGLLRNLGFIAGAALTVWSVIELIIPGIRSIIDEGPNMENILKTIGGIALGIAGLSFAFGGFGTGLVWVGIGLGALIAANWDTVKNKLGDWGIALTPIVEGFKQVADIITKISTEGMSIDVLADIGSMSFSSSAIVSVVTGSLIATIGKLFGLSGTIGLRAGIITFALSTAVDIVTDVIDIANGNAEDRSAKMKELITKLLFGAAAALLTVTLGGGAWALMITVPIGIKLATKFLDDESTKAMMEMQEKVFSGGIEEALEAAQSLEDIQNALSNFTGLKITDSVFENIFTPEALEEFETGKRSLEEMQYLAADWMYLFYDKSGTKGLETWLETFGISINDTAQAYSDLNTSAANAEKVMQKANETAESFSQTMGIGEDSKTAKGGLVGAVEDMLGISPTLQTDFESVETSLSNVETAAENVGLVLSDDVATAITNLQDDATETSSVMSNTFMLAATRIRTGMNNTFSNMFKSFGSGGAIFNGFETSMEKIFRKIVNGMIDGVNSILSGTIDQLNDVFDKLRNTQIDGMKPFISIPRVSISKIPKLAEGAVIPANREFLAILGDQKAGTNIEAPLDTIVEAVMIAMARAGMDGGNIAAAVKGAMQGLVLKVGKKELGYIAADAINGNRRDEGKLALNL